MNSIEKRIWAWRSIQKIKEEFRKKGVCVLCLGGFDPSTKKSEIEISEEFHRRGMRIDHIIHNARMYVSSCEECFDLESRYLDLELINFFRSRS